jgi:hypothetical protein
MKYYHLLFPMNVEMPELLRFQDFRRFSLDLIFKVTRWPWRMISTFFNSCLSELSVCAKLSSSYWGSFRDKHTCTLGPLITELFADERDKVGRLKCFAVYHVTYEWESAKLCFKDNFACFWKQVKFGFFQTQTTWLNKIKFCWTDYADGLNTYACSFDNNSPEAAQQICEIYASNFSYDTSYLKAYFAFSCHRSQTRRINWSACSLAKPASLIQGIVLGSVDYEISLKGCLPHKPPTIGIKFLERRPATKASVSKFEKGNRYDQKYSEGPMENSVPIYVWT